MTSKGLPGVFHDRPIVRKGACAQDGSLSTVVLRPARLFGEHGRAPLPKRAAQLGLSDVPKRVPVHYHYREALGMAEVVYCFPVGRYVRTAAGAACLIEKVTPGTRFKLKDGAIATVTRVDPLMPWPEQHANDGRRQRRVVGTVKHIGAAVLDVTVGSSVLTCTPEHTFWSVSREAWVPARSLRRGELLKGAKGELLPVSSVSSTRTSLVDVHNLEVEIDHCYFVGNPPVLVHNGYDYINLPAWEQELVDAERLTVKNAEEALGGVHGNSLDAAGEHSIYGIIDRSTGQLLHIGETGNLEARLADHARNFAKEGIDNITHVVFETTEGKAAAKVIETELITLFKDLLGYDLPYNFGYH